MAEQDMAEHSTPTYITYADPSGQQLFNAERTALHDAIVNSALRVNHEPEGAMLPAGNPVLLFIAGGHLARKTALTSSYMEMGKIKGTEVYLSNNSFRDGALTKQAEGIYSMLPEFSSMPHLPHPEKSPVLEKEYYHLRARIFEEAAKHQMAVIIEDHCDNKDETLALMRRAKEQNYDVAIMAPFITPKLFAQSLLSDKKNLGYAVDTTWAIHTHKALSTHWADYVKAADEARLYFVEGFSVGCAAAKRQGESEMEVRIPEALKIFEGWKHADEKAKTAHGIFTLDDSTRSYIHTIQARQKMEAGNLRNSIPKQGDGWSRGKKED